MKPGDRVDPNVVVMLPLASSVKTVAFPSALFDCVPTPKKSSPLACAWPGGVTLGSCISTPLLSCGNIHTGFWSCCVSDSVATKQPEDPHA